MGQEFEGIQDAKRLSSMILASEDTEAKLEVLKALKAARIGQAFEGIQDAKRLSSMILASEDTEAKLEVLKALEEKMKKMKE